MSDRDELAGDGGYEPPAVEDLDAGDGDGESVVTAAGLTIG